MTRNRRKGAEQRYNLKMMRKHAPAPDLLDTALKVPTRPAYQPSMTSGYVKYNIFPETIEELVQRLGVHGEAAAIDALWSAVTRWLMRTSGYGDLSNPYAVASLAVTLCKDYDRKRLSFPCYPSKQATLVLDDLSYDNRQETLRIAAETIADCLKVGALIITPADVKCTYQITSTIAANNTAASKE